MAEMWKKIIAMVRKNGDRCIVMDPVNDDAFVLLDIAAYEAIVGSAGKSLTPLPSPVKIVANPKSAPQEVEPEFEGQTEEDFALPSEENLQEQERFYLEPLE